MIANVATVSFSFGLLLASVGTAGAAIPLSERQALLDIYSSTGGAGWEVNVGWLGPQGSECNWFGVVCDADGNHVLQLNLTLSGFEGNNRLTGTLPASIASLTLLQRLDVTGNNLYGPFPAIGALHQLRYLLVSFNGFSGPFPGIGNLDLLRQVDTSFNQFSGPMPELSKLQRLEHLDVRYNCRYDGQCRNDDSVVDSCLSGAPPSLAGLNRLRTFDATCNRLEGSMPALQGLAVLETFAVTQNHLSGPIPAFGDLPLLSYLDLSNNRFSGAVPSLATLPALEVLYLYRNAGLGGPFPSLKESQNLRALHIEGNQFVGPVPHVAHPELLTPGYSQLCPNMFDRTPDPDWDAAVTNPPWYLTCTANDNVFANGFED